ncbi:MAG: pentapeptide repeat-containing protein [Candidatus Limnocylindria bacterium]
MELAADARPTAVVLLERATIEGVDFHKASFDRFAPIGCTFVRCDFRGLEFDRRLLPLFASPRQTVFRECRFDECDLRRTDPGQSRFEGCTFDGARIERWVAACAEFVGCHFAGPIVASKFYGRPYGPLAARLDPGRDVNEFRGNDFSRTDLVDTLFSRGISFAAQRWPEGEQFIRLDRIHQRMQRGRAEIMRWKDLEARQDALAMLLALSRLYGEQNELIRRREDPQAQASPKVQARVWQVLESALP